MNDKTPLSVGDPCWLLKGTLLYEVTIREVNVILKDDPLEFVMYKVAAEASWITEASQHRSDLFMRPQERDQLLERVEGDAETLQGIAKDLEQEREDEEHEASWKVQEENPRIKGDDDGVEYADPRDHMEGRD